MPEYSNSRFPRKSFGNKRPGSKPFGNKSFGSKAPFRDGPREMFAATCAKCGNACEVPFRPNGEKPVYCNNCFVRETPDSRSQGRSNYGDQNRAPRNDYAPASTFHDNSKPTVRDDQAFKDLKAELRGVNERLDRMITLLTPVAPVAPVAKVSKKKAA